MAGTTAQQLTHTLVDLPPNDLPYYQITVGDVSQGQVWLTFRGLPGNLPKSNGNTFALWKTSAPNPQDTPAHVEPMPDNLQPNKFLFHFPFEQLDYSISYQTGPSPDRMCALAQLSLFPTMQSAWPSHVSLTIRAITTGQIDLHYSTLPGYAPKRFGNWIGLWDGLQTNPGGADPVKRIKIPDDQTSGDITMSGLRLRAGARYTLLYFMAPEKTDSQRTTAGAAIYFQTGT